MKYDYFSTSAVQQLRMGRIIRIPKDIWRKEGSTEEIQASKWEAVEQLEQLNSRWQPTLKKQKGKETDCKPHKEMEDNVQHQVEHGSVASSSCCDGEELAASMTAFGWRLDCGLQKLFPPEWRPTEELQVSRQCERQC